MPGLGKGPSRGLDSFQLVFKMSKNTFNYIFSLVHDDLAAAKSSNKKAVAIEDQVGMALRRLNSGDTLENIGVIYGVSIATVSKVTWRFVESMEKRGIQHLNWPKHAEQMNDIKTKFKNIRGLPNCCGAIDTTDITMNLSTKDLSNNVWRDHEQKFSMPLQAVVDPDMRFRDIVTGWPGSMDEYSVLTNSQLFKLCENGTRLNGSTVKLSNYGEIREYVIGDGAFPLLPWLITPYQGKEKTAAEMEFNEKHSATRKVAQMAFARLKETWKYLQGDLWRPDRHKLPRTILVCCILHNLVIDLEDEVRHELPLSCDHEPSYKQRFCNYVDLEGSTVRDKISLYLSKPLSQ